MRSCSRALAILSLALCVGAAAPADAKNGVIYAQDFNRVADDTSGDLPDGSTIDSDNGLARVLDRALLMTRDQERNMHSVFVLPDLGPGTFPGFEVSFDFLIEAATLAADGISLNFGPLTLDPNDPRYVGRPGALEDGVGVGLAVTLDTWGSDIGYGVALDGGLLADSLVPVPVDGSWHRARIEWTPNAGGGQVSLWIDGEPVFQDVATPGFFPAAGDRFAFAARTGGYFQDLWIDDVVVAADRNRVKSEAACDAAKLKALAKHAQAVLRCDADQFKRDDRARFRTCRLQAEDRLTLTWSRLLAKGSCRPGLALDGDVGTRDQIDAVLGEAVQQVARHVDGPEPGSVRAAFVKALAKLFKTQFAIEAKQLKKPDEDAREDALVRADESFRKSADKLADKAAKRGTTADANAISGHPVVRRIPALPRELFFRARPGLSDDLLLYWNFDGVGSLIRDRSGSRALGTGRMGGAVSRVPSRLGHAAYFHASGGHVYQWGSALSPIGTSGPFTACAWIRPQGPGSHASAGGIVFNKEGEFELARFPDGTIRYAVATPSNTWGWVDAGLGLAPLDAWTHVCLAARPGLIRVSVNARSWSDHAAPQTRGDVHPNQDAFWVGDRENGPQSFEGEIDEVAVWTRVLGEDEIEVLYDAGHGLRVRGSARGLD